MRIAFADLWLLWVLLPAAILWILLRVGITLSRRGQPTESALRFSSIRLLARLAPSSTIAWRTAVRGLRVVAVVLLAIALLRPQSGREHSLVISEGIDIVIALDTSGSMRALDLDADRSIQKRRNRLEVAKSVVESFIAKRENDQMGLVVFGSEAFTQCPLTLDHGVLATFLERLEIGMAGDATAIGDAIGTAVKRLKDSQARSKVIVLLTDGRQNQGSLTPRRAAEIAQTFGIKIYTIGAATKGRAPILVDTVFGQRVAWEDVEIDEETLTAVATITGGAYFRAEDSAALDAIYERIDAMEKTEVETRSYMEYEERFGAFVLPAILLVLLEALLLGTRLRKIP